MTTTTLTLSPAQSTRCALPAAYWLLRIGAALCFIRHGAFGFITKAAWLRRLGAPRAGNAPHRPTTSGSVTTVARQPAQPRLGVAYQAPNSRLTVTPNGDA
jgi:hypothetical protein